MCTYPSRPNVLALHLAANARERAARRKTEALRRDERNPILQYVRIERNEHAILRDGRVLRVVERESVIPKIGKAGL